MQVIGRFYAMLKMLGSSLHSHLRFFFGGIVPKQIVAFVFRFRFLIFDFDFEFDTRILVDSGNRTTIVSWASLSWEWFFNFPAAKGLNYILGQG